MMMMMMIVKQKTFIHYVSLKMVLLTLPNLHLFLRQRGYKTSTTHLYSDHQIVQIGLMMRRRIIDDDDDDNSETKEFYSLGVPENGFAYSS